MDDTDWSECIGLTRQLEDVITPAQAGRAAAVLDLDAPAAGTPLPPLWHWAFFQDMTATEALGEDGHAERGEFLPAVDLPNRMWAGSRITFHRPLLVGNKAVCNSTIDNVVTKQGRSGPLVFVTVRHDCLVDGELTIREEQDIVYRAKSGAPATSAEAAPSPAWTKTIQPSAALLFRYSAVTFNAHRIHYDYPYVTDLEGYSGLVVHGPLIATLMCEAFTQAHPNAQLRSFSFRGRRPLLSPQPFEVAGRLTTPGRAEAWAANSDGIASFAEVEFE